MELSKILRAHSRTIAGKQQLVINAFAKALEVIAHFNHDEVSSKSNSR